MNDHLANISRLPLKRPSFLPVLAQLIPIGNGSMALKTKVTEEDLDTWITPREASQILGISVTSVYALLKKPYLTFQRPLPRKIRINLASVVAFKRAADDAAFWGDSFGRAKYLEGVASQAASRANPAGAYNLTLVNGTLIAKPKAVAARIDVWLTPKMAASFLGIRLRRLYELLDDTEPFLVSKHALKRKILISRDSVLDYKRAIADPEFWREPALRAEFVKSVSKVVAAQASLQQVSLAAARLKWKSGPHTKGI